MCFLGLVCILNAITYPVTSGQSSDDISAPQFLLAMIIIAGCICVTSSLGSIFFVYVFGTKKYKINPLNIFIATQYCAISLCFFCGLYGIFYSIYEAKWFVSGQYENFMCSEINKRVETSENNTESDNLDDMKKTKTRTLRMGIASGIALVLALLQFIFVDKGTSWMKKRRLRRV